MKNKKIIILLLLFISFCFLLFCLFNFYKLYDSKIKVYEKQKNTYENLKKENNKLKMEIANETKKGEKLEDSYKSLNEKKESLEKVINEKEAEKEKEAKEQNQDYTKKVTGKVIYLTFDDGPSTTNTPKILDILDKYNIKATFFVLGSSIDANEGAKDILKEEVKRGHAIANHTYGHDYSYLYPGRVMNVKNILSDLEKSQNAMKAVLGKDFSTRVIRFPGGYWSWEGRTAMKEALEQNQYYNVDWNALNKDAEGTKKNAEQLVQCAKESVKALGPDADSVVLLMHDTYGKEETVKALPQIIEYLQSQGFEFRSIK